MLILLWFRALRHFKFHNWNHVIEGSLSFVIQRRTDLPNVVVGQYWKASSVNRITGKVTLSCD